jgi:DNA anti-recombination protein RmuC
MVEQQRATATALVQIVEVQRDLTRKISSLEDLPDQVRERLSENFSTVTSTHQRLEKSLSDITTGLSNGYLRTLREDLTHLLENRTAQIIGSLSDTVHRETSTSLRVLVEGHKEISTSTKEAIRGLIWRFSFVFGGIGLFLSTLVVLMEWLRRR